ncbi:hypothetical protein E2C01_002253 [Portunus trituberculatus]|uniref:Uncharacterized protein n=1 Tax=Portunus trituberculatus TaxID=210409 RepID=A0A5B7CJ91_PORTR|nr:hypothetical protein [Portunus trituberculatus]
MRLGRRNEREAGCSMRLVWESKDPASLPPCLLSGNDADRVDSTGVVLPEPCQVTSPPHVTHNPYRHKAAQTLSDNSSTKQHFINLLGPPPPPNFLIT